MAGALALRILQKAGKHQKLSLFCRHVLRILEVMRKWQGLWRYKSCTKSGEKGAAVYVNHFRSCTNDECLYQTKLSKTTNKMMYTNLALRAQRKMCRKTSQVTQNFAICEGKCSKYEGGGKCKKSVLNKSATARTIFFIIGSCIQCLSRGTRRKNINVFGLSYCAEYPGCILCEKKQNNKPE